MCIKPRLFPTWRSAASGSAICRVLLASVDRFFETSLADTRQSLSVGMTPIQCGMLSLRTLTHLSLIFGLLAAGSLFLAIATDFWLYTTESLDPVIIPETPELLDRLNRSVGGGETKTGLVGDAAGLKPGTAGTFVAGETGPGDPAGHLIAKLHSGLWRSCVFSDDAG